MNHRTLLQDCPHPTMARLAASAGAGAAAAGPAAHRGVPRRIGPAALLALLAAAAPAQLDDFTWTQSGDPSGSATVGTDLMHIVGPSNWECTTSDTFTHMTATATQSGTVTAHYHFENLDGGFGFWVVEDPVHVVDGVVTYVGPGEFFEPWDGDVSFHVQAGQSFGFGVNSSDCKWGPGVLDVTDFEFTPDAWQDLGNGMAGVDGLPKLVGLGSLVGGSPYTLSLVDAAPLAPAPLVLSLATLYAPVEGGTLVPDPTPPLGVIVPLTTGPAGRIVLNGTWPTGLPSGIELYLQYWVTDVAGPFGWSASNAVQANLP